ncbi:MAG: ABC transporter substrate-binding protein [Oligoflexales bacterium]
MQFFLQSTLIVFTIGTSFAPVFGKTLTIAGWLESSNPATLPEGLASSPVTGRLACPPLTRLNLMSKKNEPFLIKNLKAEKNNAEWTFEPTADLQWWSGTKVTAKDIKNFLDATLETHIKSVSVGLWDIPKHEITTSDNRVTVSWQKAPEFGPFVMNGISLHRKTEKGFECAGDYSLSLDDGKLTEMRLAKNRQNRVDRIFLSQNAEAVQKKTNDDLLEIQYAQNLSNTPWTRLPNEKMECDRPIDLPIATMVTWNPNKPVMSPKFRQAMTHLMPRGAILRYGTAGFGDLISGPILRGHPGYKKELKVRPHDIAMSSRILDDLGMKRAEAHELRAYQGKPIKLTLYSEGTSNGVLEKVLFDSFTSIGIDLTFSNDKSVIKQMDGVLTSMRLPWPDENFLPYLHSNAPENPVFWPLKNKNLDENLEQYAKSLTVETPDFGKLQRIHEILYSEEPFSLIVQHHGCLVLNKGSKSIPKIFIRDPDWLYSMIRNTL